MSSSVARQLGDGGLVDEPFTGAINVTVGRSGGRGAGGDIRLEAGASHAGKGGDVLLFPGKV